MPKAIIVGAGRGGTALLPILTEDQDIKILGVADINQKAPGIKLAKNLGIPTTTDFLELLKLEDLDVIIDVTGNPEVAKVLAQVKPPQVEVMGGLSAKLMWSLVEERQRREEEVRNHVQEHEALYRIGLLLTSAKSLDEVFTTILESALKLTKSPAGSLALFDEKTKELHLRVSIGFSPTFSHRWKLRGGGLTSHILGKKSPVAIPDVTKEPTFDNPVLLKEGIRSLIAAPLMTETKTVGILYVDDFTPRDYGLEEVSILSLLATKATLAIIKAQLLEQTKELAITDDLTALNNRRYFIQRLTEEVKRAKRYKHFLSLMFLDIDYFKNYNDTYGHLQGDDVLQTVAKILKENARDIDIVARYGGEEFAILVPEAEKGEAISFAQRMREAVEKHPFTYEQTQPGGKLTISVGVSNYPADAQNEVDLISKADKALYTAKKRGRNQVCAYTF